MLLFPGSLRGFYSRTEVRNTYRLAEVTCAGVHALQPLAVAAAPTSVDGHTWRFKEGVCGCSKLLPHIYTHLTWHALSLSPLIINTCRVIGKSISYTEATKGETKPTALGTYSYLTSDFNILYKKLQKQLTGSYVSLGIRMDGKI